jgi:hypothetical protein
MNWILVDLHGVQIRLGSVTEFLDQPEDYTYFVSEEGSV